MSEIVLVRQKSTYETEIFASNPEDDETGDFVPVDSIFELTPYGLLLVSIGTCTTILLHSYAQNRNIDLEEVEIRLEYQRSFQEDCDNCEDEIQEYEETILKEILFKGPLDENQQRRLAAISHQCPVNRMVEDGVKILTSFPEAL